MCAIPIWKDPMGKRNICWMSGLEMAAAIKNEEISPVEILEAILERIEAVNPKINAIVTLAEEKARAAAKSAEEAVRRGAELGPLHGVPVYIKDNQFTKGVRTTFGSKLYENYVPTENAVLVERLEAAGAIVLGKTNMPEFGLLPITDNLLFGPTRNPWDLTKTPGGSSGGSAAAVAAGLGPLATGNDGGGSIRIPASLCGIYGFKPSFGRIPSYPSLPGWETLVHEGPLTRTVADAALMMEVMAGPDERDRFSLPHQDIDYLESTKGSVEGLRVAYSADLGYAAVDPEVREATRGGALAFEKLGCEVEEADPDIPNTEGDLMVKVVTDTVTSMEDYLGDRKGWEEKIYPLSLAYFSLMDAYNIRDLVRVQFRREHLLWDGIRHFFKKYDLLLTPSTAVPAFDYVEGGSIGPAQIDGKDVTPIGWIAFTYPFNFTGQPAASIPCGFTKSGLPIGLQIVGRRYDEATVLKASAAFERARPWRERRPPI